MPTQIPKNGRALSHDLGQRLHHAVKAIEALLAIGKRADARQHDAVGAKHAIRIARHQNILALLHAARGALERLCGRMQIAGSVVDDGNRHRDPPGSGNRPMIPCDAPVMARG
jgi:hypothetical protein